MLIGLSFLAGGMASLGTLLIVRRLTVLPWRRRDAASRRAQGESGDALTPGASGERFIKHGLAVTELYIALVEQARLGWLIVDSFQTETAAYWPDGLGGWLVPDAFVKLRREDVTDCWWYEVDLASRPLPAMRAKLMTYLDFAQRGERGPDGMVPRVIIGVPSVKRQAAVWAVIHSLPEPAVAMLSAALRSDVVAVMASELTK